MLNDPQTQEGEDAFGEYSLHEEPCDVCKARRTIAIQYFNKPVFPAGIKLKDTIHKVYPRTIGITCGCYAKLHRQVAHIQGKMRP